MQTSCKISHSFIPHVLYMSAIREQVVHGLFFHFAKRKVLCLIKQRYVVFYRVFVFPSAWPWLLAPVFGSGAQSLFTCPGQDFTTTTTTPTTTTLLLLLLLLLLLIIIIIIRGVSATAKSALKSCFSKFVSVIARVSLIMEAAVAIVKEIGGMAVSEMNADNHRVHQNE